MFAKKTLEQHVNEFLAAMEARSKKVTGKINQLNAEADTLKKQIEADTAKVVEFELADDSKSADQLRLSIRNKRAQVAEMESEVEGYRGQLQVSSSAYAKQLEDIKAAAVQAEEQRNEEKRSSLAESERLKKQRDELDEKIKQLGYSYLNSTDYETVRTLQRVLEVADTRYKTLGFSQKEAYARDWLKGNSVEHFFKAPDPDKGITVTFGEGHVTGYENGGAAPAGMNNPKY